MKKNKMTVGFVLSICAAILSVAAAITYTQVMYRISSVYVMFAAVAVLTCAAAVIKVFPASVLPILNALLIGSGAVWGAKNMVNQLGYVVAGLDGVDTIKSFIVFEVFAVLALLVNLVAGFMRQRRDAEQAVVVTE